LSQLVNIISKKVIDCVLTNLESIKEPNYDSYRSKSRLLVGFIEDFKKLIFFSYDEKQLG